MFKKTIFKIKKRKVKPTSLVISPFIIKKISFISNLFDIVLIEDDMGIVTAI